MVHNKAIIVNATALDQSGALSILRQFVENIPDDNRRWIVFISDRVCIPTDNQNVRLVPVANVKSLHRRLWWDYLGLKKWLKRHSIEPAACISLQNTDFRVPTKEINHYIYYHQPIPFYPYRWNPLKRSERTLWFYKVIYPFFVKSLLTSKTKVFVQLDYIKRGFCKFFKHPTDNVKVYCPSVSIPGLKTESLLIENNSIKLFYPASGYSYKNHSILYQALEQVDNDVNLYLTLSETDVKDDRVHCLGAIPFAKVCELYHACDALVFPSYIETYGLPLLEAALTGIPIIAADLPYAREVLAGYEGVTYVKYDNPTAWANEIKNIKKAKRYQPIDISKRPGWSELFENIK